MKNTKVVKKDPTSTPRVKAHLGRLEKAKGKRLLVDLDSDGREALESLLEAGYAESQRNVVIKALVEAAKKNG